jgi:hypothetical protein
MSDKNVLTPQDIASFTERLKATIAAAERGVELTALLSRFLSGGAATPRTAARATSSAPSAKAAEGKPRATRRGRKAGRRAIEGETVIDALRGYKNGASIGDLAQKLGETNPERLRYALGKLRAKKAIRMTGQRSSAKYHAA